MSTVTHTPSRVVDTDPTQTVAIRRDFVEAFDGRTEVFRGDIRNTVEHNDAFDLTTRNRSPQTNAPDVSPRGDSTDYRPHDTGVESDADRRLEFTRWLQDALSGRFLETDSPNPYELKQGGHYTSEAITQAFLTGFRRAGAELRAAGYDVEVKDASTPTTDPFYKSHLEDARVETYGDVSQATWAVFAPLYEAWSDMLMGGRVSRRDAANKLIERVRTQAEPRFHTIANASVVRTANRAALLRYEREGVDRVGVTIQDPPDGSPYTTPWVDSADANSFADATHPVLDLRRGDAPLPPFWPHTRAFIAPAR